MENRIDGRWLRWLAVSGLVITGAAVYVGTTDTATAANGLVAAYGFDEGAGFSAFDSSGNALTGTVDGPAWSASGKFGGALQFDGTNDLVTVLDDNALDLTVGLTMEAWVNPTTLTNWRTVMLKELPSGLAWSLYASNGARPNTHMLINGTERSAVSASALPLNSWTHLAATYDGSTMRLFTNGAQVASFSAGGSLAVSDGSLQIGGNAVWAEWFAGLIDEVRIYDRALTAAEIQVDMSTAVGTATPPPSTTSPPPTSTIPPTAGSVGRWSAPVELNLVAVTMAQLHTGKILMFRGMNEGGSSAALYDPSTGTRKAVPAPYNIFCSGITQLADGRIMVVGGHDNPNGITGIARAAIFDPVTETWTQTPPMSQRRWYPSATTLPDGKVLVTSGSMVGLTDIADVPEIYDPVTNTWTQLTSARLAFPFYPFSFLLPDGRILIAGAGERLAPTRVLDLTTNQWSTIEPGNVDGGSAVMYAPGKVMKSGTAATTDEGSNPSARTTYVLDMNQPSPAWRQTAPMARPRAYHTLTPLPDGTVIATGGGVTTEGKSTSAAVYEAEIWSPTTETWTTMASAQRPRLYHGTGMLLPDARVMLAGSGDSYGGPDQTTAEFFEPPYLFKGPRPTLGDVPATSAHGETFNVTVTGTVAKVSLERLGAVTHQFDENARHLDLSFVQNGNELAVTAPPNANVAPPGYYMLFAVSSDGVPSVARFIRLPAAGADDVQPTTPTDVEATGGLSQVDLSWTAATDNVGVTGYDVHRSTVSQFTPAAANLVGQTTTATTYRDTGLQAGTYYYKVLARDATANRSAPSAQATAVVTGDTTPPTVSMTGPADGSTVSGTIVLTASASDNLGVASVQFRLDGTTDLGAPDTSAPYSLSWNSSLATNGAHTLTAVAKDAAGNQQGSASIAVTISNIAPPPPAGLVGAWSFDDGAGIGAADASGTGNHGAVQGATWTADGRFNGSLSFDGVNDRIDVPDAPSLDLTTGMTLEAWVKPSTLTGWRTAVLKERPGDLTYALYASNGTRPSGHAVVAGSERSIAGSSALALNTWSHLATTFDGSTIRLFVNGTQVATQAASGSLGPSSNPLRIGGNAIWNEWFAGQIDEVRVYNRALTAVQIQTDMATPIGTAAPSDTESPTTPGSVVASGGVGRVDLSWAASSDSVGVTGYAVHRSTTPSFIPSAANKVADVATTSHVSTGLAAGTYFFRVFARDAAGNLSTSSAEASATVTSDTTAPTVGITAPTAGSTVSGTVSVTANAADAVGVVGVQFKLDGANLGSEDTTAPFSTSWNTTTVTNGSHVLEAVARDAANNSTTSTSVSVNVSNTAPPPPPSGLIGAWSFNAGSGTVAADTSGSANNGTISGATWTSSGRFGNALNFDGVNDRVNVPDSNSLDLTTGMTVEAWVRPSTTSGWRTVVMKERSGGLAYGLYSSNDTGRPEVDVRIGSDRIAVGTSVLPSNAWSHVAATYDGTTMRLYVDGVQVGSRAQTGSITTSTTAFRIGGNAIWSEWFAGTIDDVRVYNRALTAAEISADMTTPVG